MYCEKKIVFKVCFFILISALILGGFGYWRGSCAARKAISCGEYKKHDCIENRRIVVFLKPLSGMKSDTHGVVLGEVSPFEKGDTTTSFVFTYKIEGGEKGGRYELSIHEYGDLSSIREFSYGNKFSYVKEEITDKALLFDVQLDEKEISARGQRTIKNKDIVLGFCKLRGRSLIVMKDKIPVMIGVFGLANPDSKI